MGSKLLKGLGAFGMGFANGLANMKPDERRAKIDKIKGWFGWEKPAAQTEMSDWGKEPDDPYADAWSGERKAAENTALVQPEQPDMALPSASAAPADVEVYPVEGFDGQTPPPSIEDFFGEAVREG